MALDLKIILYPDDTCSNLYLEDVTGLYNATSNTGGYNTPNMAVNSVTAVTITLTRNTVPVVYNFTVVNGVITAATATLSSGTPVNILADMTSTAWPFAYPDNFNLTPSAWSDTFPTFEDGVLEAEYVVDGSSTYTTTDNYLNSCSVCCCIAQKAVTININDTDSLVANLIPQAYLSVAGYANEAGLVDKASKFLTKATDICDESEDCGCGCS